MLLYFMWVCSFFLERVTRELTLFPSIHFHRVKIDALLRCRLGRPWTVLCADPRDNPRRTLLSKKEHSCTCTISVVKPLFCLYNFSLTISLKIVWLNHGECMYMWAGQWVLHLLQDLFKQGKLSLTLTLTWLDVTARGSCNDYNWDSWAPCIALHASRNVAQRLKRLETIQVIEHSAVVNACKKGANSYCWSQVITVFIRRTTKSLYILYGTPLKFYPSPRTWRHHASRPIFENISSKTEQRTTVARYQTCYANSTNGIGPSTEICANSELPHRYNVCTNAKCIRKWSYGKESLKM